ncbi:MAG: hypothetical protein HUU16_13670, partial [Candidatus Omnitrophica bacterium]|nr:hypothetical protein [Candidatus Omnitrophota bacterium]
MSRLRSAFTLGAIFTILAGVCAPRASAVVFNTDLTTVPGPGGIVSLNFTVSNTAAGALSVDVYRISSSVMPVIGAFTAGTLIGSNIPVNDGAPTTLVNTGLEATNVANGFNAGTTTVSAGEYWYLVRAKEVGIGGDVPSSIQGAVADANPPSTMGINQFTLTCSDGTGNVDVAFVNPNDEVGDSGSNPVLHPVRQFASPSANYRFDFILYRVAQSEAFDLTSDPVPGNIVTTQEIFPYDRDNSTTYTDPAPAGTALAYGIRIQDTVGNQSGGSPLSSNQRASAVTPPDDVAAAQLLLAGVPVNCVSFTMNTLSLVSDPGDVTPAVVRVYARDDGALIDSSNLGSSFLIDSINYSSGTSNDTIIYYHTPSNPTLPRLNNVTYTYGIVLVTDNNRTSCVSNSVSLLTTDILPPDLIELATPADGAKVNGTVIFSATVSDDSPAGGGIQTVTFELNGNTIGVASNVTVGPGTGTAQVSFDTTTLPDGLYTYSATAADYNGNSLETGSGDPGAGPDFTIRIDNTPATVTVDSPTKNTPVNVQFALSGTAVDANATIVSVTVNYSTSTGSGFVLASGTSAWTGVVPVDPLFADDEILYVTVEALDDCGLVGVATSCFCVDNLCPIAFISAPSVFGPGGGAFIVSADDDDFLGACNAGINQVTLTALLNGATEVYTSGPPPALGGIHILPTLDFNLNHGETSIITIEARDGAVDVGNECFGASATVTADYEPPICSLISPASGDVVTAISIIGQATDVGAAGVLESCVEVVGVTTICGVTQVTGLVNPGADGLYTLIMSSTDTVGNATVCDSVVVRVDTVPPVVDITSPLPPNVGVNVSFLLSGTASDLGSGVQAVTVEYTTDSGTSVVVATVDNPGAFNVNWSAVIPVDPLLSDDEIFSVTAYAVDAANLQGSDTENYFVDDTSSCAVLGFPTAGSSVFVGAAGLVLSATLGDDDASSSFDTGVTAANATALLTGATDVLFTSDPPALGSTPINSPFDPTAYGLGDGDVSDINVCLVDGATGTANICCVTFEVIVDLTAPTCSIDAPEDGVCFSFDNTVLGATDITISATDLGSGLAAIGYRILNSLNAVVASATVGVSGTSATFTFSENVVGLGDGTYTLISQATDEVGNGGQCDQITFTVRTTGPLTTINNPFRAIVNDNLSVNGFSTVPTFSSGSSGLPGPGTPAGQSALTPGDDDSVEVNFSGSFAFPFFGVLYDSVW